MRPITTLYETPVSHYRSTREALAGSSAFVGHTYDKIFSYQLITIKPGNQYSIFHGMIR